MSAPQKTAAFVKKSLAIYSPKTEEQIAENASSGFKNIMNHFSSIRSIDTVTEVKKPVKKR